LTFTMVYSKTSIYYMQKHGAADSYTISAIGKNILYISRGTRRFYLFRYLSISAAFAADRIADTAVSYNHVI